MNIERLKVLEAKLRSIADMETTRGVGPQKGKRTFDMSSWAMFYNGAERGDKVTLEGHCGAAGCALGWATTIPEFEAAGLNLWVSNEYESLRGHVVECHPAFEGATGMMAAARFFDVTEETADELFFPANYIPATRGGVTPLMVASRVEKLVKIGDEESFIKYCRMSRGFQ